MRIEFVIDELVLDGFDPRDRHRIADALERELASAATAAHVLPIARAGTLPDPPPVSTGPNDLSTGAGPDAVGRCAGRAILGALGPGAAGGVR